ncbi:MAG TPA: ElyC/SanA/YdcF family protein [Anaerolineaceae bacterium]|nr:ElyC/SanA/YdcF family protein [Anaerolineaceae bacterium]
MRRFLQVLVVCFCAGFILVGLLRLGMIFYAASKTVPISEVIPVPVVIVPGAGLSADGTPSVPLRDRVQAAVDLYLAGKAQKILMSGDNSTEYYNEPESMRQYALSLGVPDEDIVLDYAGRRTYDTCYRAREIFGIQTAVITTQPYHLPRAVFLCDRLGINIQGVEVEQSRYVRTRYIFWQVREVFATLSAVWDIYIAKPLPILGQPEPIFP